MSALDIECSDAVEHNELIEAPASVDFGVPRTGNPHPVADGEQSLELKLQAIALKIRRNNSISFEGWLDNAYYLCEAKELAAHGAFEIWCQSELKYSKSTAENFMRVASVLGPRLKNVTVTVMPSLTLLYLLSARNTPEEVRDEFLPRVIAGDEVGPALRTALKQHRIEVKSAKSKAKKAQANDANVQPSTASHQRDENTQETPNNSTGQDTKIQNARSAVLALIVERLGDGLPKLMELVDQAGSGCIFSIDFERRLQAHLGKGDALDPGGESPSSEVSPMPPEAPLEASMSAPTPEVENTGDDLEPVAETVATAPGSAGDVLGERERPRSAASIGSKLAVTYTRGPEQVLHQSTRGRPASAHRPAGPRPS